MGRTPIGNGGAIRPPASPQRDTRSLDHGDGSSIPPSSIAWTRFTSGIVLVAKTRLMQRAMQDLVVEPSDRARNTRPSWRAVLSGATGRIELPIGPDTSSTIRVKRACRADVVMPSVTVLREVIRRFKGLYACSRLSAYRAAASDPGSFAGTGILCWGICCTRMRILFLALSAITPGRPGTTLSRRGNAFTRSECGSSTLFPGREVLIESSLPDDFLEMLKGLS